MKTKSFLNRCEKSGINVNVVSPIRKKFVLVLIYLENGFHSIMAFSDSEDELFDICKSHPKFGSNRHVFCINPNVHDFGLDSVKDKCLINICINVGELLAVGEFAMLKKSYFKSQAWFEKAKNLASLGSDIIDNY